MEQSLYFPIFVNLEQKKVVVIGGGTIAARRVKTLLVFKPDIIVISPAVNDTMKELLKNNPELVWKRRSYQPGDCSEAFLAVAATNCREVNQMVGRECQSRGIFVSVADRKAESSFYFPAIAVNGAVVAGITSSGTNHGRAARAAKKVRNCLIEMQQEENNAEKEIAK